MRIDELTREQLIELKQRYLTMLAEEGDYAEIVGVDYNEPSYWDLAHADEIVPDDVLYRNYEACDFVEEDFSTQTK